MRFQYPYHVARDGFWGAPTSTLNWCEEDYNITYYCAELVNTCTNLAFLYLGIKGIRDCIRYDQNRVFIVAFLGYLSVGLGSIAFHTTLKYSMQLADELPMIYSTCIMAWICSSYKRSKTTAVLLALALFAVAATVTVVYAVTKDPVFHQVAFALLTCGVVSYGMYIMEYELRPTLRQRSPAQERFILSQMWRLALTGVGFFVVGFAIWILDNVFCTRLRQWRGVILLPWSVLLEGHGWWHIFTGLGGYYFIMWRVWSQCILDGGEKKYVLQWPSPLTSVPRVVPIEESGMFSSVDEIGKRKKQ